MSVYVGIDPGVSGGIAVIRYMIDSELMHKQIVTCFKFKDSTEADISNFILSEVVAFDSDDLKFAMIEKVSSSPQMGVTSAFTFGRSYGFLRGLLVAHGIAFEEVRPQVWQKSLGCLSGGDKNKTKAKAQQLFPKKKWTHATADAALIAEHCRREVGERASKGIQNHENFPRLRWNLRG